jgi:hypothetical protein
VTPEPTVQDVVSRLAARTTDALSTLEMLRSYRAVVESERSFLENPAAVLEYLDFFIPAIDEVVAECERIARDIAVRPTHAQVDTLRQIAANCRAEQRRCLLFRDKCINRPLQHERMRPLLNDISVTTRDQLTAFFDLENAAATLGQIVGPEPDDDGKRTLGRRQLFTRLFKPPKFG